MTPTRKQQVNGHTAAEFYWAGDYPVYVDNRLTDGKFEDIVARLEIEGGADGGDARRSHA